VGLLNQLSQSVLVPVLEATVADLFAWQEIPALSFAFAVQAVALVEMWS
jgi:hypothetical protein